MLIQELTRQESLEVLARTHLGRLACARGMQPYIVPIHFAYQDYWLYSFSMLGQKIDWMRANPLVCVEADQMRRELWATVVVFGRYEELCDTPEFQSERMFAFNLLQQRAMWWEHGGTKKMPGGTPALVPVFYRIKIEQITGRCAASEQEVPDTKQAKAGPDEQEWLHKMFRRVRHPAGR
jgi:nitroimidazol reductase NimA-like FMN-containing flavoprotein (pyridoxamine 5'-phosphate oxidase superfamily)